MLPKNNMDFAVVEEKEQPSKTFKMNAEKNVVRGTCDDVEALKQAIFLMLNIERYSCPLVSFNFGAQLSDLIGMPVSYCIPQAEYRIRDTLMQDDRIDKVYDFSFDTSKKGILLAKFKVDSIFGSIEVEKEVSI
ncbi:DUF2634 domain-containing protein [Roseburia hominis]|uniref:DUF2634 domain-containing protein n=1 Tax=Roseburia hominis TaxID=301301 RepID=UPI001F1B0B88|nr:DUF2634 domain-containing protein [Roseburia hominis]